MSYQSKHTGTTIDNAITDMQSLQSIILNTVYPVGSLYTSFNSTSPANIIGGTWIQIQDCFLMAAGSSYAIGTSGGSANITLTKDNLPSHTHSFSATSSSAGNHGHNFGSMSHGSSIFQFFNADSNGGSWVGDNQFMLAAKRNQGGTSGVSHILDTNNLMTGNPIVQNGAHTHTITGTSEASGSGTSFSNLPPYKTIYMWQRTA